ncbi:MAG TPA: tripartite tricarboxylate transporter substrate binding protein [Xanthobacteraceae bacterium]|nr:tripartite tricarboxylate transporter substrate binding protein [Xanthobacteraceae bacterium]
MKLVWPGRMWIAVVAVVAVVVLFCRSVALAAESFPSKPIRLIVTFPPGGSADLMARTMQPQVERRLGQSIIIDNRPGAGGAIGLDALAKAVPDGYVIGIGAAGALAVNISLNEKLPYDPFIDLSPISGLAQTPFVLAAPPSFPGSSIADVISIAKRAPQSLSIGHGGNGTAMHLTAQLFNHLAGLDITLVPYRGSGPVTQDLVAGHIPLGITDIPSSMSQIQARQIKVIGITSRDRFPAMPDIPTFAESGLPGYDSIGWFGFVAPAGTAPDVIATLNAAIVATLRDPVIRDRIRAVGAEPMPGSPAEFGKFIRTEYEKWAGVVNQSGARQR